MAIQILIVDDEAGLPDAIRDYLEDETEFAVTLATSGEEGIEMLDQIKPDVCIVDMRLPGMNGNEFIIKIHEKLPECKFIIHTGSIDYSLPPELKKIGITKDLILSKPVKGLATFKTQIQKLIES